MINVGGYSVRFPNHIPNGGDLERSIMAIVNALERTLRQEMEARCNAIIRDYQYEIDHRVNEMKGIFHDLLKEFGNEISLEELDRFWDEVKENEVPAD